MRLLYKNNRLFCKANDIAWNGVSKLAEGQVRGIVSIKTNKVIYPRIKPIGDHVRDALEEMYGYGTN